VDSNLPNVILILIELITCSELNIEIVKLEHTSLLFTISRLIYVIVKVYFNIRPHTHSVNVKDIVANETDSYLVFRSELKVGVLIKSKTSFIVRDLYHFKHLGVWSRIE
jgi:hypothetical protein